MWTVDGDRIDPTPFPATLTEQDFAVICEPTDSATALAGIYFVSADCTVVPNAFTFKSDAGSPPANMAARVRVERRSPAPPP